MGSLFGADHSSSFRFWGAATSGRLGRVTVLPQLKVDRLCSVVDGTAEFDPKPTSLKNKDTPDADRRRPDSSLGKGYVVPATSSGARYSAEQAIAAMDQAGVDRALIHPVL